MKKVSHQEIQLSKPSLEMVKKMKRNDFYAILDNVRSLHNVGSIFRTSDAVLLKKLFLCGITGTPPRKEISKTALGAEELVPWEYFEDTVDAVKKMQAEGVKVVAVEIAHDSVSYEKFDYDGPICFVFGHEVEGISDEVMEVVDAAIHLPMLGRANSLNVANCYTAVVYEALKHLR